MSGEKYKVSLKLKNYLVITEIKNVGKQLLSAGEFRETFKQANVGRMFIGSG